MTTLKMPENVEISMARPFDHFFLYIHIKKSIKNIYKYRKKSGQVVIKEKAPHVKSFFERRNMLDFIRICQSVKKGFIEVYPKFNIGKTKDLMIRGGDFYAIWNEAAGLWSTDEFIAIEMIDKELDLYYKEHKSEFDSPVRVMHLWDSDTGIIDKWHKYVQKQLPDNFHPLDENLTFLDTKTCREDYASRRLPYPLADGPTDAYNALMSVLYSDEERHKIEWAIGSIVSGESKDIQKFLVLYGSAGTGKSTVLNIIQKLFDGYYASFDAESLASKNDAFALEPFAKNPLLAIQHDGDLSKIETNTRLNSIVSHEEMVVNQKFRSLYSARFNAFLFMGTNKPVRITDAKSGILRRLIDVTPTGNKIPFSTYTSLMQKIDFELGGIAKRCLDIYKEDPHYYDKYIPINMMGASNTFYDFVCDTFDIFEKEEEMTLARAFALYKEYCLASNVSYPMSRVAFKEELKSYYAEYYDRKLTEDGTYARNVYRTFLKDKFHGTEEKAKVEKQYKFIFEEQPSILDKELANQKAQYATDQETPMLKWDNVKTKLSDLDTSRLHYVRVPKNHIVIDFDIKDRNGEKSFKKNLEAANKWPATYAELSKSGKGIHLHYIYDGDVSLLKRLYDDDIEIKVFSGKSSLRRKLTKCNNQPIATINSGLPLKEEAKMINFEAVKSEKGLRTLIKKNLNKEIHGATKPSVDFIFKILEDAYKDGLKYDVTDLRADIFAFAASSTHNADYCMKLVSKMKFKSEEPASNVNQYSEKDFIFFDVEVFPNLFIVVWKALGKDPVKMINPSPEDIEKLLNFKLIGFNCRRYDNHILYARYMGYDNMQLYKTSQRIINGDKGAFFGEAYNLSYTDIYDFSSKKQSLKKFEIELGIHHQELGLPWDKPVDESLWDTVAGYCVNDVLATEAVFLDRQADWTARKILADIAGLTPNDTTNTLTTTIIFGNEKKPQSQFVYTDLSEMFPGYTFDAGKSSYRGEDPGEGGYVYAEPGMYTDVALLDVASMHPTSIEQLNLFGPYTKNFSDIKKARIAIKHKDYETAKKMFDGKLAKYLSDDEQADALAYALKIAINSVYGLTSAKFDNKCRDPRNVDNIVAKRGALFMINLKHEVQDRGYTVAHIKTDSIKIPNADKKIIDFVMDYGKQYGYIFEHEATYSKMCLVNDAVYIAKYKDGKHAGEWTATGTQFQIPYVFKRLFSKEKIEFEDLCETKTVTTALYLDMNEGLPEGEHEYVFVGKAGQFCPIKQGCGGGILLREKTDGGYSAATGSKGYRWMESEMVRSLGKEKDIDVSYYERLADEAIASISEYGDYEWFVSDDI